jgi:hypothetical protein
MQQNDIDFRTNNTFVKMDNLAFVSSSITNGVLLLFKEIVHYIDVRQLELFCNYPNIKMLYQTSSYREAL